MEGLAMEEDVAEDLQALHGRLEFMAARADAAVECALRTLATAAPADLGRERALGAEVKALRLEISSEAFRCAADRPVPPERGYQLASVTRAAGCLRRVTEDALWIAVLANAWADERPDGRLGRLAVLVKEDREMLFDSVKAVVEQDAEGARCVLQRGERVGLDRAMWYRGLIAALGAEEGASGFAVLAGEMSRRCAGIEGAIGEVASEALHHVWFRAGVWGMIDGGMEV